MKRIYRKLNIIPIILSLIVLLAISPDIVAQEAIKIIDQSWNASFRDHLTFNLSAESTAEIVEIDLFFQVVGRIASSRNEADFTPGTSVNAEFIIDQTEPANYFPPGTQLEYWWKITDADGNELKTEKETLLYLDNRYDWKTLQNERLTLYWYEGGDDFGQSLFDRANVALDTLETDMGITLDNPIKIFIYANHNDLLGAIRTSAQEWTGGQAFTTYGVVVIGIHPRQLDWGLNAMTHEMSHLVIHQATENPFGALPRWLDEGIAVYNENRDELDQDFLPLFERAAATDQLMSLRTLSSPFPADPMLANLAYGHSGEVVRFIVATYGSEAMAELLDIFAEGALYDEALEQSLGVDTDALDNAFRASVGLPPLPGTEDNPAVEVEANPEVAAPESEAVDKVAEPEEVEESVAEESEESTEIAEAPTESTESIEESSTTNSDSSSPSGDKAPERANGGPLGLSCLAGLLPLFVLALAVYRKL